MFTLKFFSKDGSYAVHSCDSYQIIRSDGQRFAVFNGMQMPIEQKLIVENHDGKTIDLLRGGRHGMV